jgi:hypothetical protein
MPAAAPPPGPVFPQATGVRRVLLVAGGLVCVGLAYVGWVLPGVPATPFVLAASYCFARSSPRLQRWLLRAPFFGPLLADWHRHRGMRPAAKLQACLMLTAACSLSAAFAPVPAWVRGCIAAAGLVGLAVILLAVPTVRPADS